MGEARRRGTYEERKKLAVEGKGAREQLRAWVWDQNERRRESTEKPQ